MSVTINLLERDDAQSINDEFKFFSELAYVKDIFSALPYIGCILNENRQVVFTNKSLIKILNYNQNCNFLGKRPGEILSCRNALDSKYGCSTTENCKLCGAFQSISIALETNKSSSNECRIISEVKNENLFFDLRVTAKPIYIRNKRYIVLIVLDISNEKRKEALEKIFFHDILNTAGGLLGIIDFLKHEGKTFFDENIISLFDENCKMLLEQIREQRDLVSAENNNLNIYISEYSSMELLEQISMQYSYFNKTLSKKVCLEIDKNSEDLLFHTDSTLLKRVLGNAVKNAFEASEETVTIGTRKTENGLKFWIHNPDVIPEDAQKQIFQRSFSTKGNNRGLGTYSMKLLTEKYLQGKISFSSDDKDGTFFWIELPSKPSPVNNYQS